MKILQNLSHTQLFNPHESKLRTLLVGNQYEFNPDTDRYVVIEEQKVLIDGLGGVNRILGYANLQGGIFVVAGQVTSYGHQLILVEVVDGKASHKNKIISGTVANIYQNIREYTDLKPLLDSLFGSRYAAYV